MRRPQRLGRGSLLEPGRAKRHAAANSGARAGRATTRVEALLEEACFQAEPGSAICVQRFDDSLNSAIRTTYRISLRSSSLREPRYPSAGVVCLLRGATRTAARGQRARARRGRHLGEAGHREGCAATEACPRPSARSDGNRAPQPQRRTKLSWRRGGGGRDQSRVVPRTSCPPGQTAEAAQSGNSAQGCGGRILR